MTEIMKQSQRLLQSSLPLTPPNVEQMILEGNQLLETLPDALDEINERRYAAELTYERKKAERLDFWMSSGLSATQARARATRETVDDMAAWQLTKREYHYCEKTMRALETRINSLLNINRGMVSAYNSHGR